MKYTRCFVLFFIFTFPTVSSADSIEYYDTWKFEQLEKYKLTWFYNTKIDKESNHPNIAQVNNKKFVVHQGVRPPTINGIYLLEHAEIKRGEDVLDLGTGTGIHAIFAAEKARRVVATDIFGLAVDNARINAQRHGVEKKIDFRTGDLFTPLSNNEKFDVIYFNINYPFKTSDRDRKNLHERFFSQAHKHLKPNGRIYYQTSFIKNFPHIYDMLNRYNFRIMELHMEYTLPHKHEPVFMMLQSNKESKK